MPEYLSPGVYIEELEIGAKPIEGVSTSTAGCLGKTERGPTDPRLVTSFPQFQRLYGGFLKDSNLAYAVDGFFANGGQRCFIGRIVGKGAKASSEKFKDENDKNAIEVTAIGPGKWGDGIKIKIENASLSDLEESLPINPELFKLTVSYYKDKVNQTEPSQIEIYDNLSPSTVSSESIEKRINDISLLIKVERLTDDTEKRITNAEQWLKGGTEGDTITATEFKGVTDPPPVPGERTGLFAFEEVDEISIVFAPDENAVKGVTGALIEHCEKLKDRFAVLSAAQNAGLISKLRPPQDSKYAAFYYPWIEILDPVLNIGKLVPPSGHIAGIYARSDIERGVHKAPANEVVRGVTKLQFQLLKGDQDILNPRGVNVLRSFLGRGIRVWGARTVSTDSLWKYVNVRRLFIFIEESIEEGTQWVVFEPNDERLWARVRQTITQFLTRVWRDGALMGTTPEEAFFVKCDRSTMTQDDIDNGRLIVLIGVAPVKPAEFVIFRIAQWTGGSEVTE